MADFFFSSVFIINKQKVLVDNRIVKYFNGDLSTSEKLTFLREVEESPELKDEFISYRNVLGLMALADNDNDKVIGRQSYNQFMRKQSQRIVYKRFLRVCGYAAMIALLVGGTYVFTVQTQKADIVELAQNKIYVQAGQRANILLSDGTEVWMNANTTMIYPSYFTGSERRIKLSGEAFFKVARNEKKPFIVSTDKLDVKVLGTTFDVSAYEEWGHTSVSLLEGAVEVKVDDKDIVLSPKEVLYHDEEKTVVGKLTDENSFSWRYGIFTFEKESLSEVMKKLELYFHVQIIVKNEALKQKEFTGKFRQRDGIMDILKILQKVYSFKIHRDEVNNVIILE